MINAIIRNGDNTLVVEFPMPLIRLNEQLISIGLNTMQLPLFDEIDDVLSVNLYADNDIGNHLIRVFDKTDTISTVNLVCNTIARLNENQQNELENDILYDQYNNSKELLNDLKRWMSNPAQHSVLFSKVELWTEDGSECEFFVGGIPTEYDDLDGVDEFETFMDLEGETKEYRVCVTSYSYGEGETVKANDDELVEIKGKFDNDAEWMSELTPLEDSEFTFDWDVDELFNLNGMEDM